MRTWWEVADVVRGDVVRAREWRSETKPTRRTDRLAPTAASIFRCHARARIEGSLGSDEGSMNDTSRFSSHQKSIFRNRTSKQSRGVRVPTTPLLRPRQARNARAYAAFTRSFARDPRSRIARVTESRFDRLPYIRIETNDESSIASRDLLLGASRAVGVPAILRLGILRLSENLRRELRGGAQPHAPDAHERRRHGLVRGPAVLLLAQRAHLGGRRRRARRRTPGGNPGSLSLIHI